MKARNKEDNRGRAVRFFMRFVAPAAAALVAGMLIALIAAGCSGSGQTASFSANALKISPALQNSAETIGDSIARTGLHTGVPVTATPRGSSPAGTPHTLDPHAGQHQETCSTCGGSGTVMHNVWVTPMRTCSFCFGTGLYNHLTPDTLCPICHGSGQVPAVDTAVLTPQAETCTACGGAGFVWVTNL